MPTYLFFFFFFRPSQIILLPCSSNVAKIARFSTQNLQLLHFLADANQKCTRCERRPDTRGKNRMKWHSSNSSSNDKRNAVGPWTSSSSSATRRRRKTNNRVSDGWMMIISSYFHPQLPFRIHLIFILVATVVATFYHSPKKEKAVFFFPFLFFRLLFFSFSFFNSIFQAQFFISCMGFFLSSLNSCFD